MQTALNDPDDRNSRRSTERDIIRIVRESSGGKDAPGAATGKPRAYMWVFGPRRRPDKKWLNDFSIQ
ncbi:MAG: hypothetical protein HY796_11625 [Elusimicrobia bacterium]|nr:hypothetical protein [Elusimicrobiota bacterium]